MIKYIITAILTFALAVIVCATFLVSGGQLDVVAWKDIVFSTVFVSVVASVITVFFVD